MRFLQAAQGEDLIAPHNNYAIAKLHKKSLDEPSGYAIN
jgi:hypothetical protein